MIKASIKKKDVSIKYKLFLITSSLLLALAIAIYLILCFSLPCYYEKYKYKNLDRIAFEIEDISKNSNLDSLKLHLRDISESENIMVTISDENENLLYGYGRMMQPHKPKSEFGESFDTHAEAHSNAVKKVLRHEKKISISVDDKEYMITVIMPLQPINEASEVIKRLMPIILVVVLFFALIGAYIYSVVVTKPLLKIIEMEKKEEEKRKEFIATISHELKTPITIISGQLEGMMYGIGKYKDRDLYLKKTYDVTQELKDLVNEMIEYSKVEIMYDNMEISKINLGEMINILVQRQVFLIETKKMNLVKEINEDIFVNANRKSMEKALNNIINNAIKYSPEGESISVNLFKNDENKIELIVKNTGVTIPESDLDKIFNPFYRVEQSRCRTTGGSGLGLYITNRILEKHGFKCSVYNEENAVVFKVLFS